MSKICVNKEVIDQYIEGESLNNAILNVFNADIQDRIKSNDAFAKMTPIQMVMFDAGLKNKNKLGDMMNSAYTSGGMDTNQWLFPAWVETTLREAMYERDYIPYICTTRIGIDGNTVQSPTLNLLSEKNKPSIKRARIAEGADIPTGKIVIGERAITLWKHGRAIELTYEAARRMRIDLFSRQMAAISGDLAHQNVEAAIDVAANGDGNTDSVPVKIGTTETANAITAGDITDALMEYSDANNFNADTMVVPKKYLKEISAMTFDPTLSQGVSLQVKFNIPQIDMQNITIIGSDLSKIGNKDAMILLNKDLTLIRYEENGSNIQEMDNYIRNQMRLMTMTENSGYAIGVAGSNMYMEIKSA